MNGTWRYAFVCALTTMALLFATDRASAAATQNPQGLISFCIQQGDCSEEVYEMGMGAQDVVAGPDGAYYGTTAYSNTIHDENGNLDAGGSVYRADPVTHSVRALYQFPRDYYPSVWLKASSDGNLYGGYRHASDANSHWLSEGLFRLSSTGEFTIIFDESKGEGFSCNAPVQDSLGNWIGVVGSPYSSQNYIYKLTPNGSFKVLLTLPHAEHFSCPDGGPVLAADGNLYGLIPGSAIYRLAPDDTFTIVHTIDDSGYPVTSPTLGSDGALYGVSASHGQTQYTMYRMSLDGQYTNFGALPGYIFSFQRLTLMPDGYFYGPALGFDKKRTNILFRLSPSGEYTKLYETSRSVVDNSDVSELIRGFDNALYGTSFYGGMYERGLLFRYVPPPMQ